jgi:hypothetical protein
MSLAKASQLAQSRPSVTTAQGILAPSIPTEVTLITVCNTTGTAAAFSIYHDDDGTTYDDSTALYRAVSVAANTTVRIEFQHAGGGISLSDTGNLAVRTDTASALTFTVYGITTDIVGHISQG